MFRSNPKFIFHDSPGFEAGDERELKDVLSFIEKRSKANDPNDQLHAIWFDLINIILVCSMVTNHVLSKVLLCFECFAATTRAGAPIF